MFSRDNSGNTPLHHASASGSLKALRILLTAGADPNATNAYDWTPLSYSQTVAAEVYFKNLIAEFAQQGQQQQQEEEPVKNKGQDPNPPRPPSAGTSAGGTERRRKAGAVRLITDDEGGHDKAGSGPRDSSSSGGNTGAGTWSPVQTRRAMTPTATRAAAPWYTAGDGTRARAESGG